MTQTTKENEVHKLSMNVDHGGPLLIWDEDSDDEITKGMIIDTFFCSNPECNFVHLRAILVDEQDNVESEGVQLLSDYFDSKTNRKDLPNQSLEASFDVWKGELDVHDDIDEQSDNKELLHLLRKQINKGLSETFERRWRVAKQNKKESWKEKDWSWWRPGDMVSWNEIFPDDFQFIISLEDKRYIVIDNYCITPGCRCNDVGITIFSIDEKDELGSIFTDTVKLKAKEVHPQSSSKQYLLKCWEQFNIAYPDLKDSFQKRHKEMKRVGAEIAKLSGNFQAPVVTNKKVNRNDPCPCGSGKKYKKCCIDR